MDELLVDFLTEATGILAELDAALLRLERCPHDRETFSLVFRLVHTIKGTCGFLGLRRLERLSHAAETLLDQLRDAPPPASATMRPVLAALDSMRDIIADLGATGVEPVGDNGALIAALEEAAGAPAPTRSLGDAWKSLPQVVRDLERRLGKRIALTMRGGETKLDRRTLDMVRDPLLHMVRNAADHGLEKPRNRLASGKPETGQITIDAFREGRDVVIRVADDGNGLAMDRIRRRARAAGLASEADLVCMTDDAIRAFIFQPGFSTASSVTQVSGRGVGLDVARTNIERLRGTIEVGSVPGAGTIFVLRIPLAVRAGRRAPAGV